MLITDNIKNNTKRSSDMKIIKRKDGKSKLTIRKKKDDEEQSLLYDGGEEGDMKMDGEEDEGMKAEGDGGPAAGEY